MAVAAGERFDGALPLREQLEELDALRAGHRLGGPGERVVEPVLGLASLHDRLLLQSYVEEMVRPGPAARQGISSFSTSAVPLFPMSLRILEKPRTRGPPCTGSNPSPWSTKVSAIPPTWSISATAAPSLSTPNATPARTCAPRGRRLTVAYTAETHLHADFVSGSRELAAHGAEVLAAAAGGAAFPHRRLGDGDEVDLGRADARALATPGHTPEHLSYLLRDGARRWRCSPAARCWSEPWPAPT